MLCVKQNMSCGIRNTSGRINSFLARVHGVLHVDVVARDDLDLGGDDVGLAVHLLLLVALAAARDAPAGRSRGACVRGPTWRVDRGK